MNIKLLKREEIDDKRWNGCVHFALNALPYGYTWYLDNVCEEWEGLVYGNYQIVMPLVFDRKFGFDYLYQPFFTQQLGVFCDIPLSKETINTFFSAIPDKYKYIDIQLNESNEAPDGYICEQRPNYLLGLEKPYETIRSKYSGNLLKNLLKAEKNELVYHMQLKPEVFVDFYVKNTGPLIKGFKEKHKHTMLRIIYQCLHYSMGSVAGVYKDKELVAANFYIFHPQRVINLMPASNEEGRKSGAMAFLTDGMIKSNAGQNKYFDFEGSEIEGVAKFYESFGAKKSFYWRIRKNELPFYARIFKR